MRRISRPQRALELSLPHSGSNWQLLNNSSPCLRVNTPQSCPRTSAVHFSSSPKRTFLLTNAKDRKKNQQFIRRWQKRLLGESEPIGSRVDPYDSTSPVRIAPEEQGDEQEVLDEEGNNYEAGNINTQALYEEQYDGSGLLHVGGKNWAQRLEEADMAREFEKLTLRTYTPVTQKMAKQVEDLTGTWYTLRDENLSLGEAFHDLLGQPYTRWSFARSSRVTDPAILRENFHRAAVEIYALVLAKKNPDMSRQRNRGVYKAPEWLADVTLEKRGSADVDLVFPKGHTLESLVALMRDVPEWPPREDANIDEANQLDEQSDPLQQEAEAVVEEDASAAPVMDPATPAHRRAALVLLDPSKRFDFMSNRPVPRVVQPKPAPEPATSVASNKTPLHTEKTAPTALPTQSGSVLQAPSLSHVETQSAPSGPADHSNPTPRYPAIADEAKWRNIPLLDIKMTFALTKRVTQLTGLSISDPHLNTARSVGDLYHHFAARLRPSTTKLYDYLHSEGQRLDMQDQRKLADKQRIGGATRSRAHVGTLLQLGNVEIKRKRATVVGKRTQTGIQKVIRHEFQKRGLDAQSKKRGWTREKALAHFEGSRFVPAPGIAVSPNVAELLRRRAERKRREFSSDNISTEDVDAMFAESRRPAGQRSVL